MINVGAEPHFRYLANSLMLLGNRANPEMLCFDPDEKVTFDYHRIFNAGNDTYITPHSLLIRNTLYWRSPFCSDNASGG
jgi:hypothetical protein